MKTFLLTVLLLTGFTTQAATYSTVIRSIASQTSPAIGPTSGTIYIAPTASNFLYAIVTPHQYMVDTSTNSYRFNVVNKLGADTLSGSYNLSNAGSVAFSTMMLQASATTLVTNDNFRRLVSETGNDNMFFANSVFFTWGGVKIYKNELLSVERLSGTGSATFRINITEYYGSN